MDVCVSDMWLCVWSLWLWVDERLCDPQLTCLSTVHEVIAADRRHRAGEGIGP